MSIIDSFPKKGKQQNNLIQYTPIGTIIAVMGTSAPNNYLICDGSVYNIVDYPELANYFQTQFGSKNYFGGDNNITFAVPDLRGEFLRGAGTNSHANQGNGSSVGTHQDNGLPNITGSFIYKHDIYVGFSSLSEASGAFTKINAGNNRCYSPSSDTYSSVKLGLDASKSNSIYGNSDYVTPTNTSVLYCIAYKDYVTLGIFSSDEEETTSGHVISSNGTELEEQPVLNFTDFDISNDTDNNETDIKQHRLTQEELNEIASELPDVIDNKNKIKYSLEEQVVGEWIDGKPIYQKTFVTTSPSTPCAQIISKIADNYETCINFWGIMHGSSVNRMVTGNTIGGGHNEYIELWSNGNDIWACVDSSHYSKPLYVTVQYTKTTD